MNIMCGPVSSHAFLKCWNVSRPSSLARHYLKRSTKTETWNFLGEFVCRLFDLGSLLVIWCHTTRKQSIFIDPSYVSSHAFLKCWNVSRQSSLARHYFKRSTKTETWNLLGEFVCCLFDLGSLLVIWCYTTHMHPIFKDPSYVSSHAFLKIGCKCVV